MSKELSAREWIETNEVANLDLPDGTNEMDVEGKVKELCIAFGESYANARLEAYKEEVYKKNIYVSSPLEQGISINERIYRQGLSDGVKSVLSSLNTCDPRNTECELYDKLRPFTTTAPLPPNFSKP